MRVSRSFPSLPWFLAAIVLGAVACTQVENPRTLDPSQPGVDATQSRELNRVQFPDIPVPQDFSYVTRGNRSFSYEQGGVRVGRFFYWGKTDVDDVVAFYRSTMPLRAFDWQFVNEGAGQEGGTALDFRKGRQSCRITVSREKDATLVDIQVTGSA